MKNYPITTTLSEQWYLFLTQEAKRTNTNKKSVLEAALKEYKKQQLRMWADAMTEQENGRDIQETEAFFMNLQKATLRRHEEE